MSRLGRFTIRSVLCVLAVATVSVAIALAQRAALCERILRYQLRRIGLGNAHVDVLGLTASRLILRSLAFGRGADVFAAEDVEVTYLPAMLWERRVGAVRVVGLRCCLYERAGQWTVAGLEALSLPSQESSGSPFERITIRSSDLLIRRGKSVLHVPFSAEIEAVEGEGMRVNAVLAPFGEQLIVHATIGSAAHDLKVDVRGDSIHPSRWLEAAESAGLALPHDLPRLRGTGTFAATVVIREGTPVSAVAAVRLTEVDVWHALGHLTAHDVTVVLDAPRGLADPILGARGDIRAVRILDDLSLGPFTFKCRPVPGGHELTTSELTARYGADVESRLSAEARLLGSGDERRFEASIAAGRVAAGDVLLEDATVTVEGLLKALAAVARPTDLPAPGAEVTATIGVRTTHWRDHDLGGATLTLRATPQGIGFELDADGAEGLGMAALTLGGTLSRSPVPGLSATGRVSILPAQLAAPIPGLALTGEKGEVALTLTATGDASGSWRYKAEASAGERSLGIQWEDALKAVAQTRLDVTVSGDQDAVEATVVARMLGATCQVGDIRVSFPSVTFDASTQRLGLRPTDADPLSVRAANWPAQCRIHGSLRAENGGVIAAGDVSIAAIQLHMPFTWSGADGFAPSATSEWPGSVHTGAIEAKGLTLDRANAAFRLAGDALTARGTLTGSEPPMDIRFRQHLAWRAGLSGEGDWAVAAIEIDENDTWYRKLPGLEGVSLTGRVGASGEIVLDRGELAASCTATLEDVSLAMPEKGFLVSGIQAEVSVADLGKVRTPPHQQMQFAVAELGGMPVDGGRVEFQVESPGKVFLERCRLNWCGGQVEAYAVALHPGNPVLDVVLYANDIELDRVLGLLKDVDGRGTGRLYGKLPLSYSRGSISYDRGFLFSLPGETGTLELRQADLLTRAIEGQGVSAEQVSVIEQALGHFEYDVFRLLFAGAGKEDTELEFRLRGKTSEVKDVRPVHLDLTATVSGALSELINAGLRLRGPRQ